MRLTKKRKQKKLKSKLLPFLENSATTLTFFPVTKMAVIRQHLVGLVGLQLTTLFSEVKNGLRFSWLYSANKFSR